jgi:membrane protein DedA with SNARE-associated domain
MIGLETLMLFLLAAVIAPVVGAATVFFLSYWKGKGMVAQFMKSQEIEDLKKKYGEAVETATGYAEHIIKLLEEIRDKLEER